MPSLGYARAEVTETEIGRGQRRAARRGFGAGVVSRLGGERGEAWPGLNQSAPRGAQAPPTLAGTNYLPMRKHRRSLREVVFHPCSLEIGGYHRSPEGWEANES